MVCGLSQKCGVCPPPRKMRHNILSKRHVPPGDILIEIRNTKIPLHLYEVLRILFISYLRDIQVHLPYTCDMLARRVTCTHASLLLVNSCTWHWMPRFLNRQALDWLISCFCQWMLSVVSVIRESPSMGLYGLQWHFHGTGVWHLMGFNDTSMGWPWHFHGRLWHFHEASIGTLMGSPQGLSGPLIRFHGFMWHFHGRYAPCV